MTDYVGKVVKCSGCKQHFMHTKKDTACPFCHTEHSEVIGDRKSVIVEEKKSDVIEEKTKEKKSSVIEEKTKEKKEPSKTRKESFQMWKGY